MLTMSKAKQLQPTSPHALVGSLEPSYVHEAFLNSQWVNAMEKEFATLQCNNTWDLFPFSVDMNLIGCKWAFRVKYNLDGTVLKQKGW